MFEWLWFYVGCGVGLVLGQLTCMARHPQRRRDERGQMSWRDTGFGIVVIFTCVTLMVSTFFIGKANSQLDDAVSLSEGNKERIVELDAITARQREQQLALDRQSKCQQRVFEALAEALKSRGAFAEQQAEAQRAFVRVWRDGIAMLLNPDIQDGDVAVALQSMYDAADADLRAINESLRIREVNPYPSQEEIERCRTLG